MNPATAAAMLAPDYRRTRRVQPAIQPPSWIQRMGQGLRNWRQRHSH